MRNLLKLMNLCGRRNRNSPRGLKVRRGRREFWLRLL
jgi:hypothetical protein